MKPIDVVFGIDMETDIGSWTPYCEGLVHGTPRMLDLFARHGLTATTFWVGESARAHPDVLRDCQAAGHEIGAHSLNHETVGAPLFDIPGISPLLEHEVEPRCRLATERVADAAGERPVSWRCPRLFGGTHVTNALESLGYVCDASYPMYFYEQQFTPYHPARDDWTQRGDLALVEIPQFADMGMVSHDEYGRDRDPWPLYRTESTEALIPHIESFLAYLSRVAAHDDATRDRPAVLCFYFHPWEFHAMPSGPIHYGEGAVLPDEFLVKGCGDYCLEQVGLLIEWLQSKDARFITARACAEAWNAR